MLNSLLLDFCSAFSVSLKKKKKHVVPFKYTGKRNVSRYFFWVGLYLWCVFFFSFFKLLFDNVEEEQIESILFLYHILCQEVLPYTLHKERMWCQFSYGKRNRWTVHLSGISILYLNQWHCALKTTRQCFLFVSLKLYMWCLYALMVNLMSKSNYMLAKGTLARSRCRTLDDGLLNRLALKHDVMQSECAKNHRSQLSE